VVLTGILLFAELSSVKAANTTSQVIPVVPVSNENPTLQPEIQKQPLEKTSSMNFRPGAKLPKAPKGTT